MSGWESLEHGVHTTQLHYLRGNPQRFWTILNPRSPGTVNREEKEKRKAEPHATPTRNHSPGRAASEGQPEGRGSRLSLHHQLRRQALSSPSEGGMQPGEVRVLGCPGTAAYSHSVNRKFSGTH